MAEDPSAPVDLDEVVDDLRRRVAQRRASGEYPDGLVESLDAQFRHLSVQRDAPDWPACEVEAALAHLVDAARFSRDRISLGGGSAAKRAVHELASALTVRQVQGILEQSQAFADAARAALALQWQALVALDARQNRLEQRLESALDKLARYERGDGPPEITAKELRHELRALRRQRRASDLGGLTPEVADELLAPREQVQRAVAPLVELFASGPVLDIGLGRGETLELLVGRGLDAAGVGMEPHLVARSRAAGLAIREADPVDALAELDDGACGGVLVGQVVERLSAGDLADLVAASARVLRPDGILVVEAVNPRSPRALTDDAFRDPRRLRPVDPDYLQALAHAAGFAEVTVEWGAAAPDADPRSYAVVARR